MPVLNNGAKRGVGKTGWRCMAQGFKVNRYPRETMVATRRRLKSKRWVVRLP